MINHIVIYDAERILNKFSQAACLEVEIRHMTASLVSVVQETMEPEKTILWLRSKKRGDLPAEISDLDEILVS